MRAEKPILMTIYTAFMEQAKAMCAEEGIRCILIDHFGDDLRLDKTTNIPEPTPKGAEALAKLI